MPVLKHQATWEYCYFLWDAMVHSKNIIVIKIIRRNIHCLKEFVWYRYKWSLGENTVVSTYCSLIFQISPNTKLEYCEHFMLAEENKLSKIQPGWNNSKPNFFAGFFFQFTQSQGCFQMSGFLASRIGHTGYCKRCRTRCWYVTCERYMIFMTPLFSHHQPCENYFILFNHEVTEWCSLKYQFLLLVLL